MVYFAGARARQLYRRPVRPPDGQASGVAQPRGRWRGGARNRVECRCDRRCRGGRCSRATRVVCASARAALGTSRTLQGRDRRKSRRPRRCDRAGDRQAPERSKNGNSNAAQPLRARAHCDGRGLEGGPRRSRRDAALPGVGRRRRDRPVARGRQHRRHQAERCHAALRPTLRRVRTSGRAAGGRRQRRRRRGRGRRRARRCETAARAMLHRQLGRRQAHSRSGDRSPGVADRARDGRQERVRRARRLRPSPSSS